MVIQRGMSWGPASTDNMGLRQEEQPSTQLVNHNLVYDPSSMRTDTDRSVNTYNMMPSTTATEAAPQTMSDWKNTFNMRRVTLSNLSSCQLGMRSSYKPHYPVHQVQERCITTTSKSLEILRQNLQSAINKEFDAIIKKYLEKFFQPAVDNIRTNLGSNSVTDDHVRDICRAILEDAKQMYCSGSQSRGSSPYNELSDSETSEYRFGRPYTHSPLFRKRKESDTDSEASQSVRKKRSKPRCPSNLQGGQAPLKPARGEPIRREGPKWDPARISHETLFVMGARANKVLGFGQTRGRLYIKHPGLLRYAGDQEDKEWLSRHNLMPPTGGKAYLMVMKDIQELSETDEYRNNPNLLLQELKGFEAPDFMLQKIRAYVSNVRTDSAKKSDDLSDRMESALLMVHTPGLGVDCVSSAMTPPATVLVDSSPPTPSDALDLLECSSVAALAAGSPYMSHHISHQINSILSSHSVSPTMGGTHYGLVTTCNPMDTMTSSHATLSALLTGHINSDNSQEGMD